MPRRRALEYRAPRCDAVAGEGDGSQVGAGYSDRRVKMRALLRHLRRYGCRQRRERTSPVSRVLNLPTTYDDRFGEKQCPIQ